MAVANSAGAIVIEHETNRGYGATMNTIFRTAADWDVDELIVLDGDGQHEPADIPRLLAQLGEADVVVGSRLAGQGETDIPAYRRVGLGVVNVLTNISLGVFRRRNWVTDTQSGFRAYNQSVIESLAADASISGGMDASTDILHHSYAEGYDVAEVGTSIYYNVESESSRSPVSHGLELVSNLLNTIERDRPVMFVGVPGFLFTLVGIIIGYFAIANYMDSGTFPLGMALGSSVIFLTGLFMGLIAAVLHALKQYLEPIRHS